MNASVEKVKIRFSEFSIDQKITMKSSMIFLILFVFAIVFSSGKFLQPTNLVNIIVQNVLLGVVAIGQFLVILSGGIDLSIGSIIGFTSVSIVIFQDLGLVPALLISLLFACIFGILNGTLIAYFKLPAFIVTLATSQIIYSATQILSGGAAVYKGLGGAEIDNWLLTFFRAKFLGINVPLYILASVILVMWIYTRTTTGSYIYAIGGNEKASHLSGLPVLWTKMSTYLISSLLAGVGGIIYILRVGEGNPQAGTSFPLDSVAAVVIGGASLAGGVGTLAGTLIGVFTIGVLGNILNLLTISPMFQIAIKGIVILVAVYFNTKQKKN